MRGGALSIALNVSVSLFARTTSVVVGALASLTGDLDWPAYYLIGAGLAVALSIWFTRESNGRHQWGSPPAAGSHEEARALAGTGG